VSAADAARTIVVTISLAPYSALAVDLIAGAGECNWSTPSLKIALHPGQRQRHILRPDANHTLALEMSPAMRGDCMMDRPSLLTADDLALLDSLRDTADDILGTLGIAVDPCRDTTMVNLRARFRGCSGS
jgi:hypothetical protein